MAGVGDVLRATLKGVTVDSQTFNNVYHYVVASGTETNYTTIAAGIETALQAAFVGLEALLANDVLTGELELSEWDAANDEWDGKATVTADVIVGADVGQPLPGGNSIVMRFITESLRRQGRKFIPGLIEDNVDGNDIAAGLLTAASATAALLNDNIGAGGIIITPCTFNDDPLSPHFETTSKFVQTAFVNTQVGYQRRRQPGDGV
ncbi:MAG: hypothetical protein HKM22_04870 [Gammaproteobacteria bacterium]|nr:hypothetical protein [Gammaproteobacteria bacterium]